MARQIGIVKLTGTKGNITFYKMNGKYYARLKSSLTGKRVKKDPAFQLTMMYAGWLAKASKIASVVYGSMPEDERVHEQYRTMTGIAMKMLKDGADPEIIADHLLDIYIPPTLCITSEGALESTCFHNRLQKTHYPNKKAASVSRSSLATTYIENSS